ncbi:MAG: cytochrome [Bacteroidetes bacterium]|nr:cytochrome [Bacteroidota bacterium]
MKNIFISALAISLAFGACKSKKTVAKAPSTEPTENQLTAIKSKSPSTTMEELKKGHSIYYGACTNCHGAKDVSGYTEERLTKAIDNMAPKAHLSDEEKQAVWKYAMGVNLTAKK